MTGIVYARCAANTVQVRCGARHGTCKGVIGSMARNPITDPPAAEWLPGLPTREVQRVEHGKRR